MKSDQRTNWLSSYFDKKITLDRRNLNAYMLLKRSPWRLLNVLYTFNLRPVYKGYKDLLFDALQNTRENILFEW